MAAVSFRIAALGVALAGLAGCGDEIVPPTYADDGITIHFLARSGDDGGCQPQVWRAAGRNVAVRAMTFDIEYRAEGSDPFAFTAGADFSEAPEREDGVRQLESLGAFFGIDAACADVAATVSGLACKDAEGATMPCPAITVSQGGGLNDVRRQ